ncbi:MAG: hypothetical protein R3B99_20115 [Polyangiales bacterium]
MWITPVQAQIGRRGDQCGYHGYWANLDDPLSPTHAAIEPRLGRRGDGCADRGRAAAWASSTSW